MKARIPNQGPSMNQMLKQAQKMQDDMAALQEDLEGREYDISVGGGVVNIKINGKKEILALNIDKDAFDPDDMETLQDILIAGVNEAIKRVEDTANKEMEKLTGPLSGLGGMPGMPGLF